MFKLTAQYSIFAANPDEWTTFLSAPSEAERKQIGAQLAMLARSPLDRLRVAIVEADVLGTHAALERLHKLENELLEEDPDADNALPYRDQLLADINHLRQIYTADDPANVPQDTIDALRDRHGWFGAFAASHGIAPEDPRRARVLAPAKRIGFLLLGAVLTAVLVGFIGFGLLVAAIVLLAIGRLRTHFIALMPGGSAGIETFAIFLAGFWGIQILASIVDPKGAFIQPWVPLLMWTLAVVPLWPLVRGWSWPELRESLGWHTGRGLFREIAAGIVGYVTGLPVVALGLMLTLLLMAIAGLVSGEQAEPPAHPLPDQLAGAGPLVLVSLITLATLWAPIVEESIFRGALYDQLRGRLPAIACGLITGFIFAAVHPQGWVAWPALGSIGFVFAMLREWRGSLIPCVTAHALNNGTLVTLLLIAMS